MEKIRLLIVPKFDIGELGNGAIGEGELFYEEYVKGGSEYEVRGLREGERLYIKDGVGLALTHAGKVNATAAMMGILTDKRFDCEGMETLSVGCAGTNYEETVMGDVVLANAFVDYDLGHHVMGKDGRPEWFPDSGICEYGRVLPNQERINNLYERIKGIRLETTEKTVAFMTAFNPEAGRLPMVKMGTFATSDNYWKGEDGHRIAKEINKYYKAPGEYMAADMEDIAVARVLRMFGMEDRLTAMRVSVNLDCYMNGATAESLWSENCFEENMMEDDNMEGADIFETAMKNLFKVGKTVANGILGM